MDRKKKIIIATYYHFPCTHPVLENIFAKELGQNNEVIWLFQGDISKGRIHKWHNSQVVLCRKINGISWHSKLLNKILEFQKLFYLLYFVMFGNTKIVMIRDMPLLATLIAPLRLFFGFKLFFQYSAPLGDIDLGYTKYNKTAKTLWYLLKGNSFNALIKQIVKKADLVFPISEFHKAQLRRYTQEKKLIPITMGVDEAWLKRERNEVPYLNELKKKHILIAYFGTLGFTRKPQFILNVFAEIRKTYPNCKLILIGKTHAAWEKRELTSMCRNLGIEEHVIFSGHLERNRLQDYLCYCDLSLSPIPPESYFINSSPTKLYESLGNGVPVVANKEIYEQEKVIIESGGGIVVDYDKSAFCNAIDELLKDDELRADMAKRGREYVLSRYTYRIIAKRILPFFL